jgi:hypothetical protein
MRPHKVIYTLYHVFKTPILKYLKMFSFRSNHVEFKTVTKGYCLMETYLFI